MGDFGVRCAALAAVIFSLGASAALADAPTPFAPQVDPDTGSKTFHLPDGTVVTLSADGLGWRTDASGETGRPFAFPLPQEQSALGDTFGPGDLEILRRLVVRGSSPARAELLVGFDSARLANGRTGDAAIDAALSELGVRSARQLPPGTADIPYYVVRIANKDSAAAARRLASIPGVRSAVPNQPVTSMAIEPRMLATEHVQAGLRRMAAAQTASPVPSNYGLQSSLQSYLNSTGVDAVGAFVELAQRYGQLPGQGMRITNVSLGDLTDQAMADAGDGYVSYFGPTTRVIAGQRYLDYPSLPLIPTYVVDDAGHVDPLGTVEGIDPYLGEVLLDFSVMAPLPHDRQRPEATGIGVTDLLGIAPGAEYRLVVPKDPTIANILVAMLAAAQQTPRPDVITASLGYGLDAYGYPGRYLEDDPVARAVVTQIVQRLGIVVCISANDGTRLYTPASVGPDGGSAPTDLARSERRATSVADDGYSTIPSRVPDSGAIAVGASTLDDIFSVNPLSAFPQAHAGQFAAVRWNGTQSYSSGFGTRVNVSAPGDNIASLMHLCLQNPCSPQDAVTVLSGGTSASAPMTAAAAAVILQVARLTHRNLTPLQVRNLLVRTARPLPDVPQADRSITVGPQIDVTAAVESLLHEEDGDEASVSIARLAVAQRKHHGHLSTLFVEATNPANIDLQGPYDVFGNAQGQYVTGPITFAADVIHRPRIERDGGGDQEIRYALSIGKGAPIVSDVPWFRLMPEEIFAAAGLPLASSSARSLTVTLQVLRERSVIASASQTLTFSPTDGTYVEALAPLAPPVVAKGQDVTVHYDLGAVRVVNKPALIVSSIDHFSPVGAPIFRPQATFPLGASSGDLTIPASAFVGGSGIYGIAILQDTVRLFISEIAVVRVAGPALSTRPDAPLLDGGHGLALSRASPRFHVSWDVSRVDDADGALLEISAPAPTMYYALNTFTNQFGDVADDNGVDSPSTLLMKLPGAAGTLELDALALKLPTSLFYNVRLLPTAGGRIAGQASASSTLELDDGLAPGGAQIVDFDIVPGGASTVATATADNAGNLIESSLLPYQPATGAYGAAIATETSGHFYYSVIGSDAALQRVLARLDSFDVPSQTLQIFDGKSGAQLTSLSLPWQGGFQMMGGRVDSTRHRAALLARDTRTRADEVIGLDLGTGSLGSPIFADVGTPRRGVFNAMDLDASTGRVLLSTAIFGDLCVIRGGSLGSIDLGSGTASPVTNGIRCMTGIASDQTGGAAYATVGPIFSFPSLFPRARILPVDESTLTASAPRQITGRSPIFPVVDPVHHLLIVAFVASTNYLVDNNAMSAVGVYDTNTWQQLSLSNSFNFLSEGLHGSVPYVASQRGIQIDPVTRTGWTYGPFGQVQQFSY